MEGGTLTTAAARNPFALEPDFMLRREQEKQAAATVRIQRLFRRGFPL